MSRVPIPLTFRIHRGQEFVREETISQPVIKIGKLSSSHLRLDHDSQVSRMHAVIEVGADGQCHIIDLGSARGTLVNGRKIDKVALVSGDRVEVGDTRIEVAVGAAAVADGFRPDRPAPVASRVAVAPRPIAHAATPVVAMEPGPSKLAGAPLVPARGRAIEVAAMLGESVVGVEHLSDPRAGRVSRTTYALFAVGASMLALAGVAFAVGVENADFNKTARAAWVESGAPVHEWRPRLVNPAYDGVAFGGLGLGLIGMTWGLVRIRRERGTARYRIGSDASVEFATSAAPSESFALVAPGGEDWVCNFTSDMDGEVSVDGATVPLSELSSRGQARASASVPGALEMAIPERGRIRIRAGQNTFLIAGVARPKAPIMSLFGAVENRALAYFAGSAMVHLCLWAFLNALPPDPETLAMDFGEGGDRITRITSKANENPPEETQTPDEPSESSGGTGTSMALESGLMGTENSEREVGRANIARTSETQQLSRETAVAQARDAGILGVLRRQRGGGFSSFTATGDISSGLADADIFGGLLGDEAGAMKGGFGHGTSGFGPGGGGTGWGTIGTGRYGTVGVGDGTGTGYDVGNGRSFGRDRTATAPTVHIGQATPTEGLDKNIIRRYIRRQLPRIKYCYEKQLLAKPGISGTVQAHFQISPVGAVVSSKAGGVSDEVSSCVAEVISSIEFPRPKNGLLVQVKYPFTFRPSGN